MTSGMNNKLMQQSNRSLVLSLIIANPGITRLDLVEMSGLQKPTITNIVNELLSLNLIENCEIPKRKGKNRTKGLQVIADDIQIISARITREIFSVSLFTINGQLLDTETIDIYSQDDIYHTLSCAAALINKVIEKNKASKILAMCLGVPGPYIKDSEDKFIVEGFPELGSADVRKYFKDMFTFPVILEHDAHLSAFSEWKQLSKHEKEHVKCLLALQSLGIGIGAGLILNGKIVEGAFGIAGEIGNIGIYYNGPRNSNGERGTFEYYASTGNIWRYIAIRLNEFPDTKLQEHSSYKQILSAYYSGDPLAIWAFDALAAKMAYGLASVIFVINPDEIIIGPDYPDDEKFLKKIKSYLNKMINPEICRRVEIRYSKIQTDPTLLGGYYYVLESFTTDRTLLDRIKDIM